MRSPRQLSMSDQLPQHRLRQLGRALLAGEDVRDAIDAIVLAAGYRWRMRETDSTLVCVPAAWYTDGVVDPEGVDPAAAIEIACTSTVAGYEAVARPNAEIAAAVTAAYGPVHGENAAAVARFMSAHLRRPIATMTDEDRRAFDEFYRRNVWATDAAAAVVDESVRLTLRVARDGDH
jgi:hypothetical protein